ncbi:aminodeoxychorismate synthase component I [Entomobacter blattae]|uniref:Probable branched-chain-amino-acid aminotransferase n=1 Tax=Entomobacter blattae TaxID=2762277 RepID=A0A7H1NUA1_9PROT|nr:aminodeoxychorismate synthase component I [Entomobacter blattae]QNT79361.1 Isochorismate synthase MenF [Entomobacter blattae]
MHHPHSSDVFLLFDDQIKGTSQLFSNPLVKISCQRPEELVGCLQKMDSLRQKGWFLAGYLSYEAGYTLMEFPKTLHPTRTASTPILEFYAFKAPQFLTSSEVETFLLQQSSSHASKLASPPVITNIHAGVTFETYQQNFQKITQALLNGEIYQINYTFPLHFQFQGAFSTLYQKLRKTQKTAYSAWLSLPDYSIISLSPELFFKKQHHLIQTRPMKGTIQRGKDQAEDLHLQHTMLADSKTQAENLMIVDLLRNDLSRIAQNHSVKVEQLFKIETYETLHQLVSSITAHISPTLSLQEILKALFPCGSVTGAPKYAAMKLINHLEAASREVYTGAIGYITPDNDMCFNVPIRTLFIKQSGHGTMGIGSGIVMDSDVQSEWKECFLKADFLKKTNNSFQLIEALYLPSFTKSTFQRVPNHLLRHLERLKNSAQVFGFTMPEEPIKNALLDFCQTLSSAAQKIRLTLDQTGHFTLTASVAEEPVGVQLIRIELEEKVSSTDIFLYHKTTHRPLYTKYWDLCQKQGLYDCLFINQHHIITESTRHNFFIKQGDIFYTSPLSSGLLDGITRRLLLEQKQNIYREKNLTCQDILNADELYLTNAVRGMVKVKLCPQTLFELTQLGYKKVTA